MDSLDETTTGRWAFDAWIQGDVEWNIRINERPRDQLKVNFVPDWSFGSSFRPMIASELPSQFTRHPGVQGEYTCSSLLLNDNNILPCVSVNHCGYKIMFEFPIFPFTRIWNLNFCLIVESKMSLYAGSKASVSWDVHPRGKSDPKKLEKSYPLFYTCHGFWCPMQPFWTWVLWALTSEDDWAIDIFYYHHYFSDTASLVCFYHSSNSI